MTVIRYNDSKDWAYVNLNGNMTWEPVSYLDISTVPKPAKLKRPQSIHGKDVTAMTGGLLRRAKVIADFEAVDKTEMSVRSGEIVIVLKEEGEWMLGEVGARVRSDGDGMMDRRDGFRFHMPNCCKEVVSSLFFMTVGYFLRKEGRKEGRKKRVEVYFS